MHLYKIEYLEELNAPKPLHWFFGEAMDVASAESIARTHLPQGARYYQVRDRSEAVVALGSGAVPHA